jgi:hypothetical protein
MSDILNDKYLQLFRFFYPACKKSKQRIEMAKNKTRRNRNKTEGGSNCGMKFGGARNKNKTEGGKRKRTRGGTRKLSKGASDWNKSVMKVYAEMKKKDKDTKFGDALKEASKRKKAGTL